MENQEVLLQSINWLQGIGPQRAEILKAELGVYTILDLLNFFPFRYEDRSKVVEMTSLHEDMSALTQGRLKHFSIEGEGAKKRLNAIFTDGTGFVEAVWFTGADALSRKLQVGYTYRLYGRISLFKDKLSISHPDLELVTADYKPSQTLTPIYPSTEKLKRRGITNLFMVKAMQNAFKLAWPHLKDNLPEVYLDAYGLIRHKQALLKIHFPGSEIEAEQAKYRLKFEELFYLQVKFLSINQQNKVAHQGYDCAHLALVKDFYNNHMPFSLTNAQVRVLSEIKTDMQSGYQMNRLLQGDVGSGKTIVAFIAILMAASNGLQACLMAPTEILAEQHFASIEPFAKAMNVSISLLKGSLRKNEKSKVQLGLANGEIQLVIGTHALITRQVSFAKLGLCIIDEQHRFGVAQRAALWEKGGQLMPHVLVMTATPIPRTLAMTLYGELDVSTIDELPPGRKAILTRHLREAGRLRAFGIMREEIAKGRQVYIVYPAIHETETQDLANLMSGYDVISTAFPIPEYQISIVHGQIKSQDREMEMARFVSGHTQIMIATTVIEVGVNIPNATVMIIENAERFGLSQLHQLRGRVGRGADQSYCILMSGDKISKDTKVRLDTMVRTNDGFEIAETDLKLRGPGDLSGTAQSGVIDLKLTNLATDGTLVELTRQSAKEWLVYDPKFESDASQPIKNWLVMTQDKHQTVWSKIS